MATIVYSVEAIENLDALYVFYATERQNPDYASRLIEELEEAIHQLETFPMMGVSRERWEQGVRALIHGNYIITYSYEDAEDRVFIRNVLDGRQDIEGRFRDQ